MFVILSLQADCTSMVLFSVDRRSPNSTKLKRKEELALKRALISREEDLGTFQTKTPIMLSIPSNTIDMIHSFVYFMTNLLHSQFSPVCLQLV